MKSSLAFFASHARPSCFGLCGLFQHQPSPCPCPPSPITQNFLEALMARPFCAFHVFFLCLECPTPTAWLILQLLSQTHLAVLWVVLPKHLVWGALQHSPLKIHIICSDSSTKWDSSHTRNISHSASCRMIYSSAVVKSLALASDIHLSLKLRCPFISCEIYQFTSSWGASVFSSLK